MRCAVSCFLDWVAQSEAHSVTLRPPLRDDREGTMTLYAAVATRNHKFYEPEFSGSTQELSAKMRGACSSFGLVWEADRGAIVLRKLCSRSA